MLGIYTYHKYWMPLKYMCEKLDDWNNSCWPLADSVGIIRQTHNSLQLCVEVRGSIISG